MQAFGAAFQISVTSVQLIDGFVNHSQATLMKLSLSSAELSAIASELKVDVTTRGIFLDDHAIGQIAACWSCASIWSVETIKAPCLDGDPLLLEKEASLNPQKVTLASGVGTMIKLILFVLASYSTRLA